MNLQETRVSRYEQPNFIGSSMIMAEATFAIATRLIGFYAN